MILQVKKKTITRGEGASTHHQALLVCALWHETHLCATKFVCEKVVVDTRIQEVAKENEQLKQEIARLTKDLTQEKGKAKQAQLHQDNTIKGVKKLDKVQTVVCYVCQKEGHKFYECKVKNGRGAKKKEKKQTSKFSNTYTNKVDKRPPHLIS